MIKINLLPKEIQEKGKGQEWIFFGAGVFCVVAVIALSSYFVKLHRYEKDIAKKARWSKQLAEIQAKVAQVAQLDAQKNLLNAKKTTVVQLLQGRLLYPRVMEAFYETMPKDVWISDLIFSEDPQRNIRIVANSNSLSIDSIADWLQMLESKPERFSGVTLSAIDVKEGAGTPTTFGFSMTFTYIPSQA